MVEDTLNQGSRLRSKMARPKPVYLWTVTDVLKWYRRHCGEYCKYSELFLKAKGYIQHTKTPVASTEELPNEITGRALLRINDSSLQRMGIDNNCHRENIWREIVKQRLKTDIMEIRDMERIICQHAVTKMGHVKGIE
uniref:SAM domain-containing protein n=1 Tax=Glossina pallidipes TaxID=7398 RepID=A0A1A9ZFR9_GLOPL